MNLTYRKKKEKLIEIFLKIIHFYSPNALIIRICWCRIDNPTGIPLIINNARYSDEPTKMPLVMATVLC